MKAHHIMSLELPAMVRLGDQVKENKVVPALLVKRCFLPLYWTSGT